MMEALTSLMPSARQNTALQTTIADQHETIRVLREQLAEAKEAQTRAQLLKTKAQFYFINCSKRRNCSSSAKVT